MGHIKARIHLLQEIEEVLQMAEEDNILIFSVKIILRLNGSLKKMLW